MTKMEAMKRFGLKEGDPITEANVRIQIENAKKRLTVWSLTDLMRKEIQAEIEAYEALIG